MNFSRMSKCFSALGGRRFKWLVAIVLVAVAVLVGGGVWHSCWPRLEKYGAVTIVRGLKIHNMRDLGGMKTVDGRIVKSGMVYRSAAFNSVSRKGHAKAWTIPAWSREFLTRRLGIKTDLDLRRDEGETQGMTGSPLGADVHWAHVRGYAYERVGLPEGKAGFAKAFRLLLDESRYPVVVHCQRGRDRAGTLVALLEAVLGVPLEVIRRDYGFSWCHLRKRKPDYDKFDGFLKMLAKYPGGTINEQAVAFVKSAGFTDADIARFRALMLGK